MSVHGGLLDGFSLDERYVICTGPDTQFTNKGPGNRQGIRRKARLGIHALQLACGHVRSGEPILSALVPLAKERTKAALRAGANSVHSVLWPSVLVSLATVGLVPHSLQPNYFLANLLVTHLVLPLLQLPASSPLAVLEGSPKWLEPRCAFRQQVVQSYASD